MFRLNIYQIYKVYDHPDKLRKLHKNKTSLSGGLFILMSVLFFYFQQFFFNEIFESTYFSFTHKELNIFLLTCTLIFLIGYIDDYKNLKPSSKTLLLILVLFFCTFFDNNLIINELYFSFTEYKFWISKLAIFFTIFSIFLFINAFNLFDGIDLQAGSYSLFVIVYLFFLTGLNYTLIPFMLFLLFFLMLNYKKEIFLGDAGSLLVSFILSYLIIKTFNKKEYLIYCDQIFIIMMLPGIEMLRLFITRIFKKKNPFTPDRNHLHHILFSKKKQYFAFYIIFILYSIPVIMISFGVSTILTLFMFIVFYIFFLNFKFR